MAMGHTLDALRSRNSASLGPGASMRSAKRLDAGRRVVGLVVGITTERLRLSWVVGSRPSALPCPGSQLLVLSTARRHLDILTTIHVEASSACTVMGTGVGKATLGAGV